jgi:hypothetical protein
VGGSSERGIEVLGSIEFGEFHEYLRSYQFLKEEAAACCYLVRRLIS